MSRITRDQIDDALATDSEIKVLLSFTTMRETLGAVAALGEKPTRQFNRPVLAASLHPMELAQLENEGFRPKVFVNRQHKLFLDDVRGLSQVTRLTTLYPEFTGAGTKLAVIDSGCDSAHPDFSGRITILAGTSGLGDDDTDGHGTHVASIAAGSGAASSGLYQGVAPEASIYAVKATNTSGGLYASDILEALDLIEPLGVDVLNLSFGSIGEYDPYDPVTLGLNAMIADGVIVVAGAGNDGPSPGTISELGNIPNVICVGNVTEQLVMAGDSSRGNGAGKPDIAACGTNVVAALSSDCSYPAYTGTTQYTELSGTSMSTPVISGICLLMRQQDPEITPEQVRLLLRYTADKVGLSADEAGSGIVNAYFALNPSERTRNLSMVKLSLGLQAAVLGNYGIARMLDNGIIDVYSGDPPPLAHMAATGTHLARITKNGDTFNAGSSVNGLTLNRSNPHELTDDGTWVLTGVADGTAGWWRWKWYLEDPDTSDPYYPRLDGIVGDTLFLASETITATEQVPIDRFYLVFG